MTSLINNPLFSGISAEVLSDNLKDVNYHTKVYRKGDILARQGDICNRLVILPDFVNAPPKLKLVF